MSTSDVTTAVQAATEPDGCLRVLIADDDPVSCYLLERDLAAQGYQVQCVSNGLEALAAVHQPDASRLIVLDWMMPGMSGPEICVKLRERRSKGHYQYILLVSAKDRIADVVAGLDAGANDYLVKPFDSSELLARLRVVSRMLKLQDDLLEAQELLRFQATHDSLTGIWNRRALMQLTQAEIQRAQRNSAAIAFLMIDLDHFKNINDTCGHPTGDLVIKEVAHRLSEAVRGYDVVGRYGGEEFGVVAAGLNEKELCEYADRLLEVVSALPIDTPSGAVTVTMSIGVATATNAGDCDLSRIIKSADSSLYGAKNSGRNRMVMSLLPPISSGT